MSQARLFTFNASSFPLNPSVEAFLKARGAISLDFGATAYINSEMMPAVLSELVEKSTDADSVAQLRAEAGRYGAERQKMTEDNDMLVSKVQSYSAEVAALKEQAAGATKLMETLRAENARLQAAPKNAPTSPAPVDDMSKQSYEKLQKEFHALRVQSADALTSLKVLEDENEELARELELLKNQAKNMAAPKVS